MPSPLALVPSFVSGARDVVSPVEEAENGLADRQREREKKGKKQRKGGIEIEGRPQERRLLLSSTSARVLAALMETRSRELPLTAAKPIYLRPRSLFPSPPPPSLLGSRFPPRAAAPLPPASLFVRPPPHSLSPSRSVAFRRPSNPFTKRIVSYTGIFHFPVFSSGPVKSNLRESRLLTRAIQCERVDEGGMRIPVDFFWNL